MTTAQDIIDQLLNVLPEELNVSIPSAETDLLSEEILDSVALVNLMFLIERHWGVKVTPEKMDLEHFRTVRSMAAFIETES